MAEKSQPTVSQFRSVPISGETKREEKAGEDPATGSQGPERGAINSQGKATHCRQRDYASHAC